MNTVCIQCKFYVLWIQCVYKCAYKFYEYSVHTSQVLWIQCAYNVSFMNTVCIQCKFYEYSVHTM